MEYCCNCGVELLVCVDNSATCAKCESELNHDYDIEPDTEYDRHGRLIERNDD